MTVTPDTPQTIEGVTVSEPNREGDCMVVMPNAFPLWFSANNVRAMGLTVPEPTVPCRIGDTEFTLTREQVKKIAEWGAHPFTDLELPGHRIGAAARAHLDAEAGR